MIVAQISDSHVLPEGQKLGGLVDTNAHLEAAVNHLKGLSIPPDLVLVTGDLTEDGTPESYAALRARLAALPAPACLIPGNHDRRGALVEAFPDHAYLPKTGFLQYVIEKHPVRLVALDTLVEGREDGALCQERLAWLDAALSAAPEKPTLIFMHHPPFETGIWWMDAMGLSGRGELRDVLAQHRQVRLIICGHNHRPIYSMLGSIPVLVAPSSAWQVHLELLPETPPQAALETAAVLLHVWNGEAFVTHASPVMPGTPPIDLSGAMGDWPRALERLRAQKAALTQAGQRR